MRSGRFSSFAIAAFLVVPWQSSYADFLDVGFQTTCDEVGNRVEIAPYGTDNSDGSIQPPRDCTLASGRTIRIKIGREPSYPYGMGGASEDGWLSVWIDQARVLSREQFTCGGAGPCDLRIIVTQRGLEICRQVSNEATLQPKSSAVPKERCVFTHNDNLAKIRDVLEYPQAGGKQPPPAGSIVTLFSKDKDFCERFQKLEREVEPPKDVELLGGPSSPYEYAGDYQRFKTDINNDGKEEIVVALHSRTHYRDGDIYFVYSGNPVPEEPPVKKGGSTHSEVVYAKSANRILPHYWADLSGTQEKQLAEKDLDDGAYRFKSSPAPWWDTADEPVFQFRYWYLQPFRYTRVTYFLMSSVEADKLHWYAVLRPEPDYSVTEMCVFQVVRERY